MISILVLLLCEGFANGTTIKAERAVRTAEPVPFCEVDARFRGETYLEERLEVRGVPRTEVIVRWKYDWISERMVGDCECPGGPHFEMTVRGATAVPTKNKAHFIYIPGSRAVPAIGSREKLKLRRLSVQYGPGGEVHDEWRSVEDI